MSGSTNPGGKPAKQLSSRLMTMKFMQRGAANSASNTPSKSSVDPNEPSPKRQKFDAAPPIAHRPGPSAGTRTPKYPNAPTYIPPGSTETKTASSTTSKPTTADASPASSIDWRQEARRAAQTEDMRRQAALDRVSSGIGGETKWILRTEDSADGKLASQDRPSTRGLRVVRFGESEQATPDSDEASDRDEPWRADSATGGRMRFGKWKTTKLSTGDMGTSTRHESDDDSTSGSSAAELADHPSNAAEGPGVGDTSYRPQSESKMVQGRGGISSGGGSKPPPDDRKKCFRCGQTGHIKSQCPVR